MIQGATSLPEIDFEGIADRADLPALLELENRTIGRDGRAFCPFHDNVNTPALSVYNRGGRWRFHCFGCGARGDAIDWVAMRSNVTLVEAAKALSGEISFEIPEWDRPARPPEPEVWKDAEWQAAVDRMIVEAEARLWSERDPESRAARRYLRSRGLHDRTIRRFRLGFLPSWYRSDPIAILKDPAKPEIRNIFRARRGITIPWLAPGAWYSPIEEEQPAGPRWVGCNIRSLPDGDLDGPLPDDVPKYKAVRGSKRGYLYPWPEILQTQGDQSILLVEGEFDALVGFQELGHKLHVATAGSASTSVMNLPTATLAALALTSWIFLGFDHDRAGIDAVFEWLDRYSQRARRVLLPFGKDISEFINGGGDARGWIEALEAEFWGDEEPNLPEEEFPSRADKLASVLVASEGPGDADESGLEHFPRWIDIERASQEEGS